MWKKRLKVIAIVFIIYCVLLASVMGFWEYKARSYFFKPKTVIKIVKKERPVYKFIKIPQTIQDYKDCCKAKIRIDTSMGYDNTLQIVAYTKWQIVNQKIKLGSKTKRNWAPMIIVSGVTFTIGLAFGGYAIYKAMSGRKLRIKGIRGPGINFRSRF